MHGRHGGSLDRDSRVRAYVQVHEAILAERSLNPELRRELLVRMSALRVNPLENSAREDQHNAC